MLAVIAHDHRPWLESRLIDMCVGVWYHSLRAIGRLWVSLSRGVVALTTATFLLQTTGERV